MENQTIIDIFLMCYYGTEIEQRAHYYDLYLTAQNLGWL
jgi:hypothetical protein